MSWLSKGLKGLGKGLTKVASFAPGPVGQFASAGNAALEGKPIGKAVVGDTMRNAKIAATILPVALSGGAAAGLAGGAGAAGAAGAAGGGAGGFLSGMGGWGGLLDLGLGAMGMYQGNKQQNKANKLQEQALAYQMARDAEVAPLRQRGMEQLMGAQRPDLSSDYASSNPFARPVRRIG